MTLQGPAERTAWTAVRRGVAGRCPRCGRGRLFVGFLETVQQCAECGETLGNRYQVGLLMPLILVSLLGGVLILGLLVLLAAGLDPTASMIILVPLAIVLALAILRPAKGALTGLLWSRNLSDEERRG